MKKVKMFLMGAILLMGFWASVGQWLKSTAKSIDSLLNTGKYIACVALLLLSSPVFAGIRAGSGKYVYDSWLVTISAAIKGACAALGWS